MAGILLCGTELRTLAGWAAVVEACAHEARIVPLTSLATPAQAAADACLVDLGTHRTRDHAGLLAAVAAHPRIAFVAMTACPEASEGLMLLRAGVRGYCNRVAHPAVVEAVLNSVLGGEIWAGSQVTEHLLAAALAAPVESRPTSAELLDRLTPREAEVALRVAAGDSNKVIAAEQGISERTVKAHLNSVYRKTGVRNRVQLALVLKHADPGEPQRLNG